MAIQTQIGVAFSIHVVYAVGPLPGSGPIVVSVSNPDVVEVQESPQHPGDWAYRQVTPLKPGNYVISAWDGMTRGSLPEMEVVANGMVPPLSVQEIVMA